MNLTSDHIKSFSNDGAVLLKGAFSEFVEGAQKAIEENIANPCLLYTSPSPRDRPLSRMPSSA